MRGSMLLWITIVATAAFTTRWRAVVLFACALYFYCARDLAVMFMFYSGALLADLSLAMGTTATLTTPSSPTFQRSRVCAKQLVKRYWPIVTTLIALFLAAQPDRSPERLWWSRTLLDFGRAFFPQMGKFLLSPN
jgi:hypothetical protein